MFELQMNHSFSELDQWQEIAETTGSQTTTDISFLDLPPDREYQFRVVALNIIGISEYSNASEFYKTPAPGTSTFITVIVVFISTQKLDVFESRVKPV